MLKLLSHLYQTTPGPVFSYNLRYIIGFRLVKMAISTNQKPTIYRNLYKNTVPVIFSPLTLQTMEAERFFQMKSLWMS